MKGVLLPGRRPLIQKFPVPEPVWMSSGQNEGLTSICGSDIRAIYREAPQ